MPVHLERPRAAETNHHAAAPGGPRWGVFPCLLAALAAAACLLGACGDDSDPAPGPVDGGAGTPDGAPATDLGATDLGPGQPDLRPDLGLDEPDLGDAGRPRDVQVADGGRADGALTDLAGSHDAQPADLAPADVGQPDFGFPDPEPPYVFDPAAAARGFRLYYRERVERTVLAFQRFLLVGDTTWGTSIGKVGVARTGDEYEVVAGPNDNNRIGISTWTTWHAYRQLRSRSLALATVRLFNGLAFFEEVSGHPGLTARMVYPGWTRTVDGRDGSVTRSRQGQPAEQGARYSPELEAEIITTFYDGVLVRHREDPLDILFEYMPGVEPHRYALTYSFDALPRHLRSSDCCASLVRTPAPYDWEGAYWGNHNSRDNFPDLALGYVAAIEATRSPDVDPDVLAAARRAVAAGGRIGDLVHAHGALLTVGEFEGYEDLMVGGTLRPHGEVEAQDLGSLADCNMAYLALAISSEGLSMPLPEAPIPGSIEAAIVEQVGDSIDCPLQPGGQTCRSLEQALCGRNWDELPDIEFAGTPLLDLVRQLEETSPGAAELFLGGFQDDFNEITIAALALVTYADATEQPILAHRARWVLGELTGLMRLFAELMWTQTHPERIPEQLYDAALFDGLGGVRGVPVEQFGGFVWAEQRTAYIESLLSLQDTPPAPLLSDEELQAMIRDRVDGARDVLQQRYRDTYGEQAPVRRAGDGYEARGFPEQTHPWHPVERPHHRIVGGLRLLHALPLCATAPEVLDCTWARLGCARPDLDDDGSVAESDRALFEQARQAHADAECVAEGGWCGGADLDRSGAVDALDEAFLEAAMGCVR